MKNPIIAGALNFFLPGAGYLYVGGKRKKFGFIILISFILLYGTAFFTSTAPSIVPQSGEQPTQISLLDQVGAIAAFLLLFGFAYDAYNETLKKRN